VRHLLRTASQARGSRAAADDRLRVWASFGSAHVPTRDRPHAADPRSGACAAP
jgi:hypothetical protein